MRKRGVDLRFHADVTRIGKTPEGIRATLTDGGTLDADVILYATGRTPKSAGLGLEQIGVELDGESAVRVDAYSRTNLPHVYAVGDVTNRLNLTPMAIAEGQAVAETLFNDTPTRPDHANVATAVFSHPSIGAVGPTEEEARAEYAAIDVYTSSFRALKHTLSGRDEKTFMKLIVDGETDRVIGCHMAGPEAGEIVQGIAIAIKCGATKAEFDATVGIHPTSAEELVTMRQKRT